MERNIKKWSIILILISPFLLSLPSRVLGISWPTSGTYPKEIESDYGPRRVKTYFHKGLDFLGGPKVKAVETGEVKEISTSTTLPYIKIKGSKNVLYLHVKAVGIKEGDTVTEGQEIADYTVSEDEYGDHVDIRFNSTAGDSNPLRDLFSSLYTGSDPTIKSITITGDKVGSFGNKYYVNGKIKIDAYMETTTKDLNTVTVTFGTTTVGTVTFDYHNHAMWEDYNGYNLKDTNLKCKSETDKTNPAKDNFIYYWDTTKANEAEYKVKITATTVKNNESEEEISVIVDRTIPTVTSVSPTGTNINVTTKISATFSEPMDQQATQQAFSISPLDANLSNPTWSNDGKTVTFDLDKALKYNTKYTVTISTNARDLAQNKLANSYSWNFTTKKLIQNVSANPLTLSFPPVNSQTNISYTLNDEANSVIIEGYYTSTIGTQTLLATTLDNLSTNQGQNSIFWDGKWDETTPLKKVYPTQWDINEARFSGNYNLRITAWANERSETQEIPNLLIQAPEYLAHRIFDKALNPPTVSPLTKDKDVSDTFGNNDGNTDAGEMPSVYVSLKNKAIVAIGTADGYSASWDDPTDNYDTANYLSFFTDDDKFEGPIPSQGEKEGKWGFWAKVSPDTPLGKDLDFFVKFIDKNTNSPSIDMFEIKDVDLDIKPLFDNIPYICDGDNILEGRYGNNNLKIDPGELIGLPLELKNEGYSNMMRIYEGLKYGHKVKAILNTSDTYVKHIFDNEEEYKDIGSQQSTTFATQYNLKGRTFDDYNLLIYSHAPKGHKIELRLDIKDDVTDVDGQVHHNFYSGTSNFTITIESGSDTIKPLIDAVSVSTPPQFNIFKDGNAIFFETKILDGSNDIKAKINVLAPNNSPFDKSLIRDSQGSYEGWFEKLAYHWGPFTPNELKDGTYKINSLTADDSYGNISTPKEVNVQVEIDTELPTAEIGSLTSNIFQDTVYNEAGYQLLTGTVTISGKAYDVHFGSFSVEYAAGINPDTGWTTLISSTIPHQTFGTLAVWNTLTIPDGTYTLRLTATDLVNHIAQTIRVIEIDNTDPTAIITQPGFSQAINTIAENNQVRILGTAYDLNFKEFKLEYCDGIPNQLNPNPAWYDISIGTTNITNGILATWTTTNLIDGRIYTLRLTVTDKLEHQNILLRTIRVDTTGPEIELGTTTFHTNLITYHLSESGFVTFKLYQVNPAEYDLLNFFKDTPPYQPVWTYTQEQHVGDNEIIWAGKDNNGEELPESSPNIAYYVSLRAVDDAHEYKEAYFEVVKQGIPRISNLILPNSFDFQSNQVMDFSFMSEEADEIWLKVINSEARLIQTLNPVETSGSNPAVTYNYRWDGTNIYGLMVLSGSYTIWSKLKDSDGNFVIFDGVAENRFIEVTTPPLPPLIDSNTATYRSSQPIEGINSNWAVQLEKKVDFPAVKIPGSYDEVNGNLTKFAWVYPVKCIEFVEMAKNEHLSNAYLFDGRDIPPAKGDRSGRREASIASGGLFPTGEYNYVLYNDNLNYQKHGMVTLATETTPPKITNIQEIEQGTENSIFDIEITLDEYVKGYSLKVYDSGYQFKVKGLDFNLIGTAGLQPLLPQEEFGTWSSPSSDIEKRSYTRILNKITYQSGLDLFAGNYRIELELIDIAGNKSELEGVVTYRKPISARTGGVAVADTSADNSVKSIELIIPAQNLDKINWTRGNITITSATTTPELQPFFDYLDKIYNVAPKGLKFSPAATLRLTYLDFNKNDLIETDQNEDEIIGVNMDEDAQIEGVDKETGKTVDEDYGLNEEQNINVEQLGIFYFDEQGVPEYIGGIVNKAEKTIEARIYHTSDYAALVKKDMTPPITTITPSIINGSYTIPIATFTLTAIDPMGTTGEVVSGVRSIKYAIDNPEPDIIYIEPFSLTLGEHTIYYQAVDKAGNLENIKSFKVFVVNRLLIDSKMELTNVAWSSIAWGDYDNDGDLDLALTGYIGIGNSFVSKIYRNESGILVEDTSQNLTGVFNSSIAWGDYDNDGDLDLALTGCDDSFNPISKIYKNKAGKLIEDTSQNLTGVDVSSIAWGDYDNDGDLDLTLTGGAKGIAVSKIYRNEFGKLIEDTSQNLPGMCWGSIAWGDVDSDGNIDLALTGNSFISKPLSEDVRNLLSKKYFDVKEYSKLFLKAFTLSKSFSELSKLYKNYGVKSNTSPSLPTQFSSNYTTSTLTFSWNAGSDNETTEKGLYYNIRVGTAPGKEDIVSGKYGSPLFGNYLLKRKSLTLNLPPGTYYWAVQTIDTGLAASQWSEEQIAMTGHISLVSPTSGTVGTEVTIKGDGYLPTELIRIDFGITKTITMVSTDANGGFNAIFTVDVQAGCGTLTVSACGLKSGLFAHTYFVMQVRITSVTPTMGTVGSKVTVAGDGFAANEGIAIGFGVNPTIAVTMTDNLGQFKTVFTVDTQAGWGILTVSARGKDCAASSWFRLLGQITSVSPTCGTVGTRVTIAGNGYGASEQIMIDFRTTLTICLTTADTQGSFTATFKVDSQGYGIKTITATGIISSGVAKSRFTILPPPGSISGTVTTSTGIPIVYVIISIRNGQTTIVDKNGRYKLLNVPPGKYEVQARHKESEQVEIKRDVIVEPGKDTANINFTIDYIHKRYYKWIYASSRKGENRTYFLTAPGDYEIYNWGYHVYYSKHARDNGTYIDNAGNRLVIKVRLDGKWYRKAYYNALYWVWARKPIIVEEGYEYGGNNQRDINETVSEKTTRTYYLYPSDPKYKVFTWNYTVRNAINAWDEGSYIDNASNRLVIRVRYEGTTIRFGWGWWNFVWTRPAYFSATYYVYGRKEVGKGEYSEEIVKIPVKVIEEPPLTSKKSTPFIMLIQDKQPGRNLGLNTLEEKPKIAIMVKDVEEELTTVRLKLAFNPAKIQVEDVGTPTFEGMTTKVYLQKDIDNQAGKIDIGMVIVDEDDVYREGKGTTSDKILTNNQQSRFILEDEEKEEENIAPLAYLIIDVPQKSRGLSYQKILEEIMSCISIDEVELKGADENIINVKVDERNITRVQPELNLNNAYCYPNPTKDQITFAKLTERVKVRIFNIAGELVYGEREHTADNNNEWIWRCINNDGEKVASGIYIYILQDSVSGSMKRGKIGVIR